MATDRSIAAATELYPRIARRACASRQEWVKHIRSRPVGSARRPGARGGFNPKLKRRQVFDLATCQFIEHHENVLIYGPAGVGKSHLGQGLAPEACRRGFDALFIDTAKMLMHLAGGRADGSHEHRFARYTRPICSSSMTSGSRRCGPPPGRLRPVQFARGPGRLPPALCPAPPAAQFLAPGPQTRQQAPRRQQGHQTLRRRPDAYQRVLAAGLLTADQRRVLEQQMRTRDPIALARDIQLTLDLLWKPADTRSARREAAHG